MTSDGSQEFFIESIETEKPNVYYHQTSTDNAKEIVASGFKKGHVGGGDMGEQGFIRGTFLKETPALINSPKLGKAQVEVELQPDTQILDLTHEYPATFVQEKSAWAFPGRAAFALAGWLERNGEKELADQFHEGIRRVYSLQGSDRLNYMWPIVERKIENLGYSGVRFTDVLKDGENEYRFPATVVFDPSKISVKD